jgi:putative ABC transport system permease protein
MLLLSKAMRDVAAMGIRALLLVLVIGAGVGTAGGIDLALRDVRASRDAFYHDQALADLDVRLSRTVPPAVLTTRARAASATATETRLIIDGLVTRGADRTAAEVVGMDPQARLDRLAVTEGRGLDSADPLGAVVEAEYAHQAGLHLGDTLDLALAGHRITERVRGLARSPEYLLATASPEYLIPQPGSLAVVFLPKDALSDAVGTGAQVNDLVLDLPHAISLSTAQALAAGLPVAKLTPRDQQYSLRFTNADLRSFGLFVPVVGGVFAAVGFLLIGLSLRRIVHAQRRELGTLLAIGYRRPTVLATALLPAAVLALPGAAVAIGVTIGVARLVAHTYAAAVGFPTTVATYRPALLGQVAAVAIGVTLAAAMLPAWMLLRLAPAQAMRGDPAVQFALPRWLRGATGAAGPEVGYASRSLTRRPILSAATVLSLAGAIGLGASLNVLIGSTTRTVDQTFAGQAWTATADLAHPMTTAAATTLARDAGATAIEPVVTGPALLRSHARSADAVVVGLPPSPHLRQLHLTSGRSPAAGQVVISEQTASSLRLRPGQPVTVTTSTGSRQMTVGGVARTVAASQVYATYTDAAAVLDLPGHTNSLYLTAPPAAMHALSTSPAVARVTTLAAARSGMHDLVRELTRLIDVLLAISLGVGTLFLVSSLALSLLDRQGEFATLRALGYGRTRIATILVTEALGQAVVAAALAIPTGLLLAWPLAARIGQAWFRIGVHPEPSNFSVVIASALALAVAAAVYATEQVLRLNIATTVRARFIG